MSRYNVQILPAVFTPMYEDGSVHYSYIDTLYQHSVHSGFHGIFLNGTTGECMSLQKDERRRILEHWTAARSKNGNSRFRIFAHVGSSNLYEAAELAEHAQSQRVEGIAMVPTFYFRPSTINELIDQCKYVASAAPETPFYFYNIPGLTGVNLSLTNFVKAAAKEIPTFAGLKNSFNNLVDYQQCLHLGVPEYAMYWGSDEVFMMVYAAGNRHYVGSTYNYMGKAYQRMLEAFHSGNLDQLKTIQTQATRIYQILNDYNSLIAGKAVMRHIGVDCGPVRRPLRNLSDAEESTLVKRLEEIEFFNLSSAERVQPLPKTFTGTL